MLGAAARRLLKKKKAPAPISPRKMRAPATAPPIMGALFLGGVLVFVGEGVADEETALDTVGTDVAVCVGVTVTNFVIAEVAKLNAADPVGRSSFDTRSTFSPTDRVAQPMNEAGYESLTEVKIKFVTQ